MAISSDDQLQKGLFANLRYDVPAGMVVFLVALPLCIGIAVASDADPLAGIIAGVCGGLVVTLISKSPLSVSGPAAGLATIVAAGIASVGFEAFLVAVVLAGLMQIALGVVRLGFLAELFPLSVIKGMLAGIGIILIMKQVPVAFGLNKTKVVGYLENEITTAIKSKGAGDGELVETGSQVVGMTGFPYWEVASVWDWLTPGTMIIAAVGLVLLAIWELPAIKGASWSRLLPGPLMVVLSGVGLSLAFENFVPGLAIDKTPGAGLFVALPSISSLTDIQGLWTVPDFSRILDGEIWTLGATIAAVASIETLLCVEATDKMDPFKRVSPTDRELIAQGVGNSVSGLLGGIPLTAVIVRSSANIQSGGRTRASSFIHGVLLLSLVLSVPFLLNGIPLGSLGAILLVIGYKLARFSLFKQMWQQGYDQFLPFIVTITVTVFEDLLLGVAAGFVVGAIMVAWTNFHSAIQVSSDDDGTLRIYLDKDVSFLNKTKLRSTLAGIDSGQTVIIDGSNAEFIDHDILEVIHDFEDGASHRGIDVTLIGLDTEPHPLNLIRRGKSAAE